MKEVSEKSDCSDEIKFCETSKLMSVVLYIHSISYLLSFFIIICISQWPPLWVLIENIIYFGGLSSWSLWLAFRWKNKVSFLATVSLLVTFAAMIALAIVLVLGFGGSIALPPAALLVFVFLMASYTSVWVSLAVEFSKLKRRGWKRKKSTLS